MIESKSALLSGIPEIVRCPNCGGVLSGAATAIGLEARCENCGEKFDRTQDYVDILRSTATVEEEMSHWDQVSQTGPPIIPDPDVAAMFETPRQLISAAVFSITDGHAFSNPVIAEIGCGSGASAWHLKDIATGAVTYFGIDVAPQMLRKASSVLPQDWRKTLILANANVPVLAPDSLDIVFACGAIHHLELRPTFQWISASLRQGGLLVIYEPNLYNPLAALGRRFVKGFHTRGERPLSPRNVRRIGAEFGLDLRLEKSSGALSGPIAYLVFIAGRRLSRPTKRLIGTLAASAERMLGSFPEVDVFLSYAFLEVFQKTRQA